MAISKYQTGRIIRDALTFCSPDIATTAKKREYASGILVGLVMGLKACTGNYYTAIAKIKKHAGNMSIDTRCIPPAWREDFI